tara:strand:+ start:6010 stop:6777 length:768 start_codon:yes stop_codon:yes gene_type:complete
LKLKNVLITGAGKRIGADIAIFFAKNNWNVGLHYNNSKKEVKNLSLEIKEKFNVKTSIIKADLSNFKQLNQVIPLVAKKLGPINCLINNAASFEYDNINNISLKSWDFHINTNIRAPVFLCKSFVNQLPKKCKGNIINIIDQRVWNLTPHFTSYTLSKSALWTLTQTLALSLSPNIRVNAIGPGPTIKSKMQTTKEFEKQYKRMPLKRQVNLKEITESINLLINSPSITGQMIALDSGQHLGWAQNNNKKLNKED